MKSANKFSLAGIPLGIVGIILALVFPLASYACCVPGLIYSLGNKEKSRKRSVGGTVLNIVGLSLAAINSAIAVVIAVRDWQKGK